MEVREAEERRCSDGIVRRYASRFAAASGLADEQLEVSEVN
jgi:hypothetical protein